MQMLQVEVNFQSPRGVAGDARRRATGRRVCKCLRNQPLSRAQRKLVRGATFETFDRHRVLTRHGPVAVPEALQLVRAVDFQHVDRRPVQPLTCPFGGMERDGPRGDGRALIGYFAADLDRLG